MIDEVDNNMLPLGHVSKWMQSEHDEDGIPIKSRNRIDAVAESTMEDSWVALKEIALRVQENLRKSVQRSRPWSCR